MSNLQIYNDNRSNSQIPINEYQVPMNQYQVPVNRMVQTYVPELGGYTYLNPNQIQTLEYSLRMEDFKANKVMQVAQAKAAYEIDKMNTEAKCELVKMERREELHQQRELISNEVFYNSDGVICMERLGPDKKNYGQKVLIDAEQINTKYLVGENRLRCRECLMVYSKDRLLFGLVNERIDSSVMLQAFRKAGYTMHISHDRKGCVADKVLTLLQKHATLEVVPLNYGWNRLSSGEWVFADEKDTWLGRIRAEGEDKFYGI